MRIDQIWRYPVKSMKGERLESAELGPLGIPGDRQLYVQSADGEILSGRTKPLLLRHSATVDEHGEVLVNGLPWRDPQIGRLIEAIAGPGARLVEAQSSERFDILPLLVITDGALEVGGYDIRRLRPNVVISGVEGLAERSWESTAMDVGDDGAVIVLADLRGRCIMTTYDPDTGAQDVNVLRDINHRFGGTFALNAWVGRSGTIAVGDTAAHVTEGVEIVRPLTGRFVG